MATIFTASRAARAISWAGASEPSDAEPQTQITPVWNVAWVFYGAGLLFGLDWYLRRRWGLS